MITLEWRDVRLTDTGPPISTSLTHAETTTLQDLADGASVLEVGSAYGYSAVAMALGGGQVLAVDPHTWLNSAGLMRTHLDGYQVVDRVEIDRRTSYDALPDYVNQGRRFGLIFVDGDHAESAVAFDVTWAVKLLTPGGVLACHDYDEATCPGVRAALDRLLGPPPELVDTLAIYRELA